jgi:hypothetical protein
MRYTRDTSPTSGAPLTEAELRALVAEAASKGKRALAAVAALLAVVLLAVLVVAPSWERRTDEAGHALTCAQTETLRSATGAPC